MYYDQWQRKWIAGSPPAAPATVIVDNIAARDTLTPNDGETCYVADASADPTVNAGAASYLYKVDTWIKTAEAESLDLLLPSEISDINGLQAALNEKQAASGKGNANGYAGLDGEGKVPGAQLPAASSMPVTALGTSGIQTINRSTSDKWTLTPSATVTLADGNFTSLQKASLAITNGGLQTINIPASWARVGSGSFSFQSANTDILNMVCDGSKIYVEHLSPVPLTSYGNSLSFGDRRSEITFTTDVPNLTSNFIDGIEGNDQYPGAPTFTGKHITFEFAQAVYVTEFKVYNDGTTGRTEGTWDVRGSNNGVDWDTLASDILFDTNNNPVVGVVTNPGWYKYVRLFGVADGVTGNCGWGEIDFEINAT